MLNKEVQKIIESNASIEEKFKQLEELMQSINIGIDILRGKFIYCKKCKDFFLSDSFLKKEKIEKEKVCIFNDPISSCGNLYENRKVKYTYMICPKGCEHIIDKEEIY